MKKTKSQSRRGTEKEILNLLTDYSRTLELLDQYDQHKLKKLKGKKAGFVLRSDRARQVVREVKKILAAQKRASGIFGLERENTFDSVVKNLYQTFNQRELYPDIESKAAHLLYLIIKDHPFVDGNKRLGSFFFIYFLDKNNYLYRADGERKINNNALTALTLLLAASQAEEKDQLIALITQLLK